MNAAAARSTMPELRRRRAALSAELADTERALAVVELEVKRQRCECAMAAAAAHAKTFRDGSPRNSAAHQEIARRYAWASHKGRKTGGRFNLREIVE